MLVCGRCHLKLLGKRLVYMLKVFQGYPRTLDPRGIQTLEGRKSKNKQGNL
jgi:hypothetical protein